MLHTSTVRGNVRDSLIGSGVVIDQSGENYYVASVAHVVEGNRYLNCCFPDGRAVVAQVLFAEPRTDIAILTFRSRERFPRTFLSRFNPCVGEVVFQVGYRAGRLTRCVGRTVEVQRDRLVIAGQADQGDSGGGIYNSEGRLVGIVAATNRFAGRVVGPSLAVVLHTMQACCFAPRPTPSGQFGSYSGSFGSANPYYGGDSYCLPERDLRTRPEFSIREGYEPYSYGLRRPFLDLQIRVDR